MLQQTKKTTWSMRSLTSGFALFSVLTFCSSDYAHALGFENSLPPTAFNLGTGVMDFGKTHSIEYEKLMAKLPPNQKTELYKVQKNYLNTIADLKVQIREKQRLYNIYLQTQGTSSVRMRNINKEIESLESEWNEKTNAFRAYLRSSYNTLISTHADR